MLGNFQIVELRAFVDSKCSNYCCSEVKKFQFSDSFTRAVAQTNRKWLYSGVFLEDAVLQVTFGFEYEWFTSLRVRKG